MDLRQQLEVIIHGKHQVKIDTEKLKLTNDIRDEDDLINKVAYQNYFDK